jgi:hypothetical protein
LPEYRKRAVSSCPDERSRKDGRVLARQTGVRVSGVLGILIRAKAMGAAACHLDRARLCAEDDSELLVVEDRGCFELQ